ncbi:uncharacterized protein LOC130644537 [Hydractinia symbiolongicarpus]|uniref:uncharacterized protein LOC130644537 n=1 Tax=Hydractinia symbiolongicarpus TaxID=13093 RepID=UPI00254D0825|nr:uncharacterized protein LOC130644537 [Hydractinia symbiolongicarpus]
MIVKVFLLTIGLLLVSCDDIKVRVEQEKSANGENELISVDLKKKDGTEDIKITALLKFHLIEGFVHLNGNKLIHGVVNFVHLKVTIVEIEKGVKKDPRLAPVQIRVLIAEKTLNNGNKLLLVEEEFVKVEDFEVIQVDVKQIIWEGSVRRPITSKPLKKCKVHSMPRNNDKHMFTGEPKHSDEGFNFDNRHKKCHHHKEKHHHGKVKCWFHHLSWKSKLALFFVGFLSVIAMVLCCAICAKKRRGRRSLEVAAPLDDSVAVDMDDVKKVDGKEEKKYEFHFEFDNSVVVDDKKALVE